MTLVAVDHIGFSVTDISRSIQFYTELLGCEPHFNEIYDTPYIGDVVGYPGAIQHAAFFRLPGQPSTYLELIQYLEPATERVDMARYNAGNAHLCLQCEDIRAEAERLVAIGARPVGAPTTSDYGIYTGAHTMYFLDPDEISIQLVELRSGSMSPGDGPPRGQ